MEGIKSRLEAQIQRAEQLLVNLEKKAADGDFAYQLAAGSMHHHIEELKSQLATIPIDYHRIIW